MYSKWRICMHYDNMFRRENKQTKPLTNSNHHKCRHQVQQAQRVDTAQHMEHEISPCEAEQDTEASTDGEPEWEGCQDEEKDGDADDAWNGQHQVVMDGLAYFVVKNLCATEEN